MKTGDQKRFITGRILITDRHPAIHGGVVHIRLEDTTRIDAESLVITEQIIENIEHSDSETEIRFRVDIPEETLIDPKNSYSISVWIDVTGGGKPGSGDLFSERANRVLTQGYGDFIEVRL